MISPETQDTTAMDEVSRTTASSNMYTKINTLCFIDRLPTEILEDIFILGACHHYSYDSNHLLPSPPSWVWVSYVCQRWRNITLNCPSLWSYLFVVSQRWTEELLARSKQTPLKLQMNLRVSDSEEKVVPHIVEQVMAHSERIEELYIYIPFEFGDQLLLSRLSSPVSRLRNLTIDCWPSQKPSVLFDGDTPALQTLLLVQCPVPWYSLNLSRLTVLDLRDIDFQQDTKGFLTTLSCMRNLEHLLLLNSLASADSFLTSTAFHAFQKVKLPQLSRLYLSTQLSTVIAFLSCVHVPLQTKVRLAWDDEDGHAFPTYYVTLNLLLAQRFVMHEDQSISIPTIRSLIITRTEGGNAKVTFSTLECDCNSFYSTYNMEWHDNIPLQVAPSYSRLMTRGDEDQARNDILAAIPLSNVQSLHVDDPPLSSAFWGHVLRYLPNLRYIKLGYSSMPDLASLLTTTPSKFKRNASAYHDTDGSHNQILAPALDELELSDCSIGLSTPELEMDRDPLGYDGIRLLLDALSTPKDFRGRLTMTRCRESDPEGTAIEFDMAGWLEDGYFHVVEKRVSYYS